MVQVSVVAKRFGPKPDFTRNLYKTGEAATLLGDLEILTEQF
jgi:hypothetical protein